MVRLRGFRLKKSCGGPGKAESAALHPQVKTF
jgi:hypothetical protein